MAKKDPMDATPIFRGMFWTGMAIVAAIMLFGPLGWQMFLPLLVVVWWFRSRSKARRRRDLKRAARAATFPFRH